MRSPEVKRSTAIGANLFRSVEKIDQVTKADIQRMAKKTFVPTNRATAMIVTENAMPASK